MNDADIIPITPQGEDGGFSETGAAPVDEAADNPALTLEQESKKKQMWMDFETFCKCFK